MMMNDEQKSWLNVGSQIISPSIVPNCTADCRGARMNTRPATDYPPRSAGRRGTDQCSVWSIHILPPRERTPSSRLGRTLTEDQRATTTTPTHTCLDC